MALEYDLILAGDLPPDEVAERAIPDPAERPTQTLGSGALSIGLQDRRGFVLTVFSRQKDYIDAEGDDGDWLWEPDASVNIGFDINKTRVIEGTENMLSVVARILTSGPEDAALRLNANYLLLTRTDGVVRKHRRTWWDNYDFADKIIPG